MSAGGVTASRPAFQRAGGGASPTPALQSLQVRPIPIRSAKAILVGEHYLHSMPGGTQLAFGMFLESRLLGALTLGVGPFNSHSLVEGAAPGDCLTLSRLWLSEELPKNSESRVLGVVTGSLTKHTNLKFLLSYAGPAVGHIGTIYQDSGWICTGLSQAMPLYDIGDGKARHSRSLAHAYGTHSVRYFQANGIPIEVVRQAAKHRYLCFLDSTWRHRLRPEVLPYPKREVPDATG